MSDARTANGSAGQAIVADAAPAHKDFTAHWWQIHAWGIGCLASYFMYEQFYLILNIHTTVFKVSPLLVGAILAMPRLFDGILDPIIGHWSDNMHSRWGRRRPFMLMSALMGALLASGMFWMSPDWAQWIKGVILAFCAISLFTACGTYDMACTALGYELSEEYSERSRVQAIRNVYWSLGGIVGGFVIGMANSIPSMGDFLFGEPFHFQLASHAGLWPLVEHPFRWVYGVAAATRAGMGRVPLPPLHHEYGLLMGTWARLRPIATNADGTGNPVVGFRTISMLVSSIMIFSVIFPLLWSRERYVKVNRQHVNLWKAMKATLTCRPFVIILINQFASGAGGLSRNLFFYIGVYSVCNGDMAYYSNVKAGGGAIVGFLISLIVWPIVRPITRLVGKRVAFIGGAVLGLIQVCGYPFVATPGHIYRWFWYDNIFLVPGLVLGTATAGLMPDICDIDELTSGERREGLFTAVQAFMSKMQNSVMALLTGVFLAWTGFQGGVTHQSEQVIHRLRLLGFQPLIVISAISLVVSCFMPLTAKMMAKVRAELDARHLAEGILAAEASDKKKELAQA